VTLGRKATGLKDEVAEPPKRALQGVTQNLDRPSSINEGGIFIVVLFNNAYEAQMKDIETLIVESPI